MERTVTFTMEDALISPLGFSILSGAGIVEATGSQAINVHMTSQVEGTIATNSVTVDLSKAIPTNGKLLEEEDNIYGFILDNSGNISERLKDKSVSGNEITFSNVKTKDGKVIILVDYYVAMKSGVQQLEVTPDKFAGSYYLEASTLFRRQEDGVDMPAQFVIPNVKIQSAFNFSMASTGDPSTFTFTMDAFPDYTKFDKTKKVLFALQIVEDFKSQEVYSLV